jgi:hypothetical protein
MERAVFQVPGKNLFPAKGGATMARLVGQTPACHVVRDGSLAAFEQLSDLGLGHQSAEFAFAKHLADTAEDHFFEFRFVNHVSPQIANPHIPATAARNPSTATGSETWMGRERWRITLPTPVIRHA